MVSSRSTNAEKVDAVQPASRIRVVDLLRVAAITMVTFERKGPGHGTDAQVGDTSSGALQEAPSRDDRCSPIALPRGIGTAFPICFTTWVIGPTNR